MTTLETPTIGQILRRFCAKDPGLTPGLAFPCYITGPSGGILTFASDGETVAIWTAGRIGRYREWSGTGSPDGFSPVEWRGRWRSGCSTPLPMLRTGDQLVRVGWLGRDVLLEKPWVEALQSFDAVWIGKTISTGTWRYGFTSFMASFGKMRFNGVVRSVTADGPPPGLPGMGP